MTQAKKITLDKEKWRNINNFTAQLKEALE